MGKKKKNSNKQLSADPFKALKGFVVEEQKASAAADREIAPERQAGPSEEAADLFASQMRLLGVEPLLADDNSGDDESRSPSFLPDAPAEESEQELFLREMGALGVSFRDAVPEDQTPVPEAAPRRMKQVRRGTLQPEARLDLHGLRREVALQKVRFFLEDSSYQGLGAVLIITGRGAGSQQEAVLRPEVERYLSSTGRSWVSEWGRAPRQYGGEGALVVFLKTSGKG